MNILLDFSAIKTGGGAQLAMNFLDFAQRSQWSEQHRLFFVLPELGPLATRIADFSPEAVIVSPDRYIQRLQFEYGLLQRYLRKMQIKIVFTFFGAGLPVPAGTRSIVSVAYPTICYPDSPFWQYLPFVERARKKLIDHFRILRLRRAHTVLVETAVMQSRVARLLKRDAAELVVMPPAPSSYLEDQSVQAGLVRFSATEINVLVLSAVYAHKNLWELPAIVAELTARGIDSVRFNVSVSRADFLAQCRQPIDEILLDRYIRFLGSIPPRKIAELYRTNHIMMNISDLESFSNNYMEAWKSAMPILASNRDFARHICGDSAVYVEPHNPKSVVEGLLAISASSAEHMQQMLDEGKCRLKGLLDTNDRYAALLSLLVDQSADLTR